MGPAEVVVRESASDRLGRGPGIPLRILSARDFPGSRRVGGVGVIRGHLISVSITHCRSRRSEGVPLRRSPVPCTGRLESWPPNRSLHPRSLHCAVSCPAASQKTDQTKEPFPQLHWPWSKLSLATGRWWQCRPGARLSGQKSWGTVLVQPFQ